MKLKLTADALLDLPVRGGHVKSLRDIFVEYVEPDGGFGDDPDAEMRAIAQNLINAVLRDVIDLSDGFGGDATDFSQYLDDQLKGTP